MDEPKLALKVVKYLGGGCSGGVYSVKDVATSQLFAVKVAPKALNDGQISNLLNERFVAELLAESPWFTKLHAAWHMKTTRSASAYDSVAARWRSGLSSGMTFVECRMLSMIYVVTGNISTLSLLYG